MKEDFSQPSAPRLVPLARTTEPQQHHDAESGFDERHPAESSVPVRVFEREADRRLETSNNLRPKKSRLTFAVLVLALLCFGWVRWSSVPLDMPQAEGLTSPLVAALQHHLEERIALALDVGNLDAADAELTRLWRVSDASSPVAHMLQARLALARKNPQAAKNSLVEASRAPSEDWKQDLGLARLAAAANAPVLSADLALRSFWKGATVATMPEIAAAQSRIGRTQAADRILSFGAQISSSQKMSDSLTHLRTLKEPK